MRAAIRGQNRPAHGGKTIGKKRRVLLDDVVLRLEPGDEPFLLAVRHFAKTDEGPHLVNVVPDGFLEVGRLRDVGIDRDLEQVRLAVRQPPEQPVKQGPARRVGMERNQTREREETFRNANFAGKRQPEKFRLRRKGAARAGLRRFLPRRFASGARPLCKARRATACQRANVGKKEICSTRLELPVENRGLDREQDRVVLA